MIKLYQFPPAMSIPNASPFCMKVETYLRIVDLDYESVYWRDPRKAPKGKLPFIEDGKTRIADSGMILQYLAQKYPNDLDKTLSAEDHAIGLALNRMLEEHLYWIIVYSRWIDKRYSPSIMKLFFGNLPWPVQQFIVTVAKRGVEKSLWAQGLGRHRREEIYQMGTEDLAALAQILGPKDYLFGKQPSSYDASTFSFLASLLMVRHIQTPLQKAAAKHDNLKAYVKRMAIKCFPDYPKEKKASLKK